MEHPGIRTRALMGSRCAQGHYAFAPGPLYASNHASPISPFSTVRCQEQVSTANTTRPRTRLAKEYTSAEKGHLCEKSFFIGSCSPYQRDESLILPCLHFIFTMQFFPKLLSNYTDLLANISFYFKTTSRPTKTPPTLTHELR